MKRAAAVALFVFTTAVSAHAAVRVPDWMQAAAAQQLPSYPDKVPGVALLDETTVTVQGTDELRTTRRVAYKILGTAGRDLGVLSISFGGETKLTRMEGWSIAASGMYHVKERDAVESAAFDGELYADYKIKGAARAGSGAGQRRGIRIRADQPSVRDAGPLGVSVDGSRAPRAIRAVAARRLAVRDEVDERGGGRAAARRRHDRVGAHGRGPHRRGAGCAFAARGERHDGPDARRADGGGPPDVGR